MIAQQFNVLVDEFTYVFNVGGDVSPSQLDADFVFLWVAQGRVHRSGNTGFWRNDLFLQTRLPPFG